MFWCLSPATPRHRCGTRQELLNVPHELRALLGPLVPLRAVQECWHDDDERRRARVAAVGGASARHDKVGRGTADFRSAPAMDDGAFDCALAAGAAALAVLVPAATTRTSSLSSLGLFSRSSLLCWLINLFLWFSFWFCTYNLTVFFRVIMF